jgi:elongation factor 1 alpha-like protein
MVDDYYDEEDDDYYYDDNYDDYDDSYVAPKAKPKAMNTPINNKQVAKPQQPNKPIIKPPQVTTKPKSEPQSLTATSPSFTVHSTSTNSHTSAPSPPVPEILIREQNSHNTPLTVVILGHVDAGKSSVTGHLLYHHPSNNTKRNNKQTPQYAWLLDEDEEERAHGVTMDIATKSLRTASGRLLVLQDAPGHADYVPAAITGTALADASLLTVDVTDFATAFQAGQLREHALLARGLGVSSLLLVLNKMDLIDWRQDIFEDVQEQLMEFLISPQCGFAASKVRCVPVSAVNGENIYTPMKDSWYTGPTLWEALDRFDSTPQYRKLLEKPSRLLISDVVASTGSGVSVRAKVLQGWVQTNETVVVWPYGDETKLTRLQRFDVDSIDKERSQYASAGELIDVVLTGIDAMRISPGQILTRPNQRPHLAKKCQATIIVLSKQQNYNVIIRGAQVTFHMHSLDIPCHISKLHRTFKPDGSVLHEHPRALAAHGTSNVIALVELTLQVPICMQTFADCRPLGRFVLRRAGDTIAVGRIEMVLEDSRD